MSRRPGAGVLALWLAAGLAAAETPRSASDEIRVTQVEIAVQVLRRGEPVRGLTAGDFEVLDRGEAQEIVSFEVLDLAEATPLGALGAEAAEAQGKDGRRRHLLLLLDLDLTDWRYLPRAVAASRELVSSQLHPSDRVAVGFYSSVFGSQLLHGFTERREASLVALDVIAALVDRKTERAAARLAELARLTGLVVEGEEADEETWLRVARQWSAAIRRPIGGAPEASPFGVGGVTRDPSSGPVRRAAMASPSLADEPILRRVRELGRGLGDLARRLAGVPEPKQVLFFSQGFPARLLDDRDHASRAIFRLDAALKGFLETGWVLEAIDVRGVPSIDQPAFDGNGLFHLAHHTGGRLYENLNRLERATETIVERSSVVYVLVIQPDVVADGSFHDLEVRVPGLRRAELRHRPGYRAPTRLGRPRRLDDRRDVAELILADRELSDFELDLAVVPVPAAGGAARIPVLLEIPGEVLLERPFGGIASIEVHAYGLDASGGVRDLFVRRVDVDVERDRRRLERGGLRLAGHLEMAEGPGEVRVLVRNLANDALSLAKVSLEIVALDSAHLVVMPPLFVDRSRDWLSLALSPEEDGAATGTVRTLAGLGTDLVPRLAPSIRGDREQELVFNLFYTTAEAPLVQLRVLTARGEQAEVPEMRFLARYVGEGGGTGLVAAWRPRDLSPGGYTLEIALVDPSTGRRVTGRTKFKIVEPG